MNRRDQPNDERAHPSAARALKAPNMAAKGAALEFSRHPQPSPERARQFAASHHSEITG
jgi:hypothetical protein